MIPREALVGSAIGLSVVAIVAWVSYPLWRDRTGEQNAVRNDIKVRS